MTEQSDPRVRAQYEAFPYPARNPEDERKRLITGSPSHLDELNHYVFGGRLDFERPFRALVAGGGTGDGAIMLAQQCADRGVPAEIVYIDLSDASRAIAEDRARIRGLTSIRFERRSLLNLAGLGAFDYVDCCGVLHHLDSPPAGLASLVSVLAPGGGIGLMVYGALGRIGVYPLQAALRTLGEGLPDRERLALARQLIAQLPETNWFKRNPFVGDHLQSDAGLYDLLLHSRDRAYTVPELQELVAGAGLRIAAWIEPRRYDPGSYVRSPALLKQVNATAGVERAALAEQLAGNMTKHTVYAVRADDANTAVAQPNDPRVIPVLKDLDGVGLAQRLKPGEALTANFDGIQVRLPLPRLAGPILSRIDGRANLAAIHGDLARLDGSLDWDKFKRQFDELYAALNGINKLLLRVPAS